ncbi:hypothetical protein TCAL_04672 [Tigriopus californicus]|uniref:Major facilitator superfamily (MFS) profile domain-containing protein n=1 Tax=Tigriopus californicus TaxID=6832 RepID=A0A553NTP6_TIGCA|nr:hypothetical protein TCAL_04672 [Tigriopus californicus]
MAFLGFANLFAMRSNLSVGIVAMVNSSKLIRSEASIPYKHVINRGPCVSASSNSGASGEQCSIPEDIDDSSGDHPGDLNWSSREQGLVLGAFFYGYIATQIPGGILAEKIGGKWLFGLGTFCTAVLTLLTPLAARAGIPYVITVRVLEGLGEGVTFPAMHALIAKWLPIKEKGQLAAFIWAGGQAGTVISLPISGVLADELGWDWIFYVFGSLGCIWFVFWCFLVYEEPSSHPRISQEERTYIRENIPASNPKEQRKFPPLLKIMTSWPVIALIVAHMGENWGFNTLLTQTPTYLNNIQHFSLKTNGFLSALPYLLMWLFSIPMGFLADFMISKKGFSIVFVRKFFNSIAFFGPTLGLIWLAFVRCDRTLAVVALSLSVGLNGAVYSGFQVNHTDLSPNYAATLMGITNFFANICGFVTPYVAGAITDQNQTIEAWRTVFLISSGFYAFCNIIYLLLGSGSLQSWNDVPRNNEIVRET